MPAGSTEGLQQHEYNQIESHVQGEVVTEHGSNNLMWLLDFKLDFFNEAQNQQQTAPAVATTQEGQGKLL